jgi:hypothetical protein
MEVHASCAKPSNGSEMLKTKKMVFMIRSTMLLNQTPVVLERAALVDVSKERRVEGNPKEG